MKLLDIVTTTSQERPHWQGKYKIPWDEPGFSERMLKEHLTQDHDLASRRQELIDKHVAWIRSEILGEKPARILDLGCGPGFYSERLAALGHRCVGIDFSPASIEHARAHSKHSDLCEYRHGDLRSAKFGSDYDLAILIYGEFNAFPRSEMELILSRIFAALRPGGQVLIEAHRFTAIEQIGTTANSWFKADSGLFSERPYICLQTNDWDKENKSAAADFYIIDAETAKVDRYRNTLQGYSDDEYRGLLKAGGFAEVELSLAWGSDEKQQIDFFLMLRAVKPVKS